MALVIVGSVAFDEIETPFGQSGRIQGGSGSYISLSASYFGAQSKLVAVVGEDFPAEYLDRLKNREVDVEGVQVKTGEKSFYWKGRYHQDMIGRDTLVTKLNVLGDFDPLLPDSYRDEDYLMLGNLSPQVQLLTLERMNKRPAFVAMDTMNFWMDIAMEELTEVIGKVDLLSINDEEARQLSGEYSIRKAARKILGMGLQYLIIKKGEHGALLFGPEEQMFFAPALPLEEVFDPTGAGDTFAGGLMGHLASTGDTSFENLKRGVVFGSAMASFVVEAFGPEKLLELDKEEIEKRIQAFEQLTHLEL